MANFAEEIFYHILSQITTQNVGYISILPFTPCSQHIHVGTTRYASALTSLVESQYIKPTAATLQISPRDRLIRYEQEAEAKKRAEAGAKKGPLAGKEIIELKVLAQSRYEEEIAEIEASGLVSYFRCGLLKIGEELADVRVCRGVQKRKAKESLTSRTNKVCPPNVNPKHSDNEHKPLAPKRQR